MTSYDGFGRVASTTSTMDGTTRTNSYQYDALGDRTRLSSTSGYVMNWTYDAAGAMTGLLDGNNEQLARITYDPAGRRQGLALASASTSTSTATYGYDAVNRLASLSHDLAGAAFDQSLTFSYNPASQIVSRTATNDGYASNTAYNVSRGYAVNGLNQYTGVGPNTYGYDANGNLTSDGTSTYVYDAENRLVSRSVGVALSYDPSGRLWQVTGTDGTTRFTYDGDRLMEEFTGSGGWLRSYAHGPGPDEPLVWYEGTGGPVRRYLHADHQGSVIASADDAGNVVGLAGYDEWGIPNSVHRLTGIPPKIGNLLFGTFVLDFRLRLWNKQGADGTRVPGALGSTVSRRVRAGRRPFCVRSGAFERWKREEAAVGRRAKSGWRKEFLRALARTGNVQWAARRAGVDKGTAYNLRHRDRGFASEWRWAKLFGGQRVSGEALTMGRFEARWRRTGAHGCTSSGSAAPPRRSPGPLHHSASPNGSPPRSGEERGSPFVVRYNKREGAQLVRAGAGRWSNLVEARFTSALAQTGNVRAAAAAAGVSTTALYNRRKRYPLLEADWVAARETGCRSVSLMLIDAAEAALDPDLDAAALGLPVVSVADAIAILRLHRFDERGAPTHAGTRREARARGQAVEDMPIAAVREEILQRVAAIRAHEADGDAAADGDSYVTVPEEEGQLRNCPHPHGEGP